MGKNSRITLIILASIIGLIYAAFLFAVPAVIDLNKFTPEIQKAVKEATGLEFSADHMELNTYYDLSAGVTVENVKINRSEDQNLLKLSKAGTRIPLFPLLFKKLEIKEIKVEQPEIFITRLQNGKYDIEQIIQKTMPVPEKPVSNETKKTEPQTSASPIEPVLKGLDVIISNYSIKLTDKTASKHGHFTLKGDVLKIEDFNPEKYVKLVAHGAFYIEETPKLNYDISVATDIPPVGETEKQQQNQKNKEKTNTTPEKSINDVTRSFDPLEGLVKYDLTGNIKADLSIKNKGIIPSVEGNLNFDKFSFKVDKKKLPESYGKFNFSGKKADIDSKLFITPQTYMAISGKINDFTKQDFDINVKTTKILLTDVKKFAYSLADAFNADVSALNDIGMSGKVAADFNLKKDNYTGYLKIIETKLSHKDISKPLDKFNSALKFNKNKIIIEKTAGSIGDISFKVSGNIDSDLNADIKAEAPDINLSTIITIINNSKMFADLRPQLKDFKNVSGSLNAEAVLKGRLDKKLNSEATLKFNKIYTYLSSAAMPVSITQGTITADEKKANLKDIKIKVSNSPVNLTGKITDLTGDVDIDITAKGKISEADIKKYMPKETQKTVKVPDMPLLAKITGKAEDLNVLAQTNIDNLAAIVKIDQPAGVSNIIHIDANVKPASVSIRNTGLFAASNNSKDKHGLYKLGSALGLITLKGDINSVNTPDPYLHDINVNITGLNLSLVEPKGSIQLNGDILLKGKSSAPKAYGDLDIKNIDIPSMHIKSDSVNVALKEEEITLDTAVIKILDSRLTMTASMENKLSPPYVVKSAKINSNFMNIDKLSQAFSAPSSQKQKKQITSRTHAGMASGGNNQHKPDVPLIINKGEFFAKKLLVSNLLNNDLSFNFTIKPVNLLRIRDFITNTGGGTATGVIDMNLKTTKLVLDCSADNIEINALASTLAQTPNEIFGKMKGRIKLTTIGQTPEAMTQKAVGRTDFYIKNGHLPRLANLEYLLGANNLSIKGVSDSLLSNTLQFEEASATNQFDTLEGVVMINRGTLDVQEIKMKGKYLSSYISGTVQMGSNHSNLTILSKLSGRVVKNLGAITDLSVDKLIRQIPGEWGKLIADHRIANQYPERDKIPELNNETLPNDKDFAVQIRGILGQPQAVRMFEWLPTENTQGY